MAGENLIIRSTDDIVFVQLDDLSTKPLERVRQASFIIHATSPDNYQAWIAVSEVAKADAKDFIRRVRKAVGDADKSASGATRLSGTSKYKLKYNLDYPTVTIIHGVPGRVMTPERLQQMELLAESEPVKAHSAPARVSADSLLHPWPSYKICVMRARKKKDGSPDRSHADISFCMISITGGHPAEATAAKLEEVSEKARQNVARGDTGYPLVTARNAAEYVANNSKGRSRV
jgi:hypothetical protein